MNRLIKIFVWVCFYSFSYSTLAQTIVLKQTVPETLEEEDDDFGPNRKKFNHQYVGFGFAMNTDFNSTESLMKNKSFSSFSVYSGNRYYRKFNKVISNVFDFELSYAQHQLHLTRVPDAKLPVSNNDLKSAKYWFVKMGGAWGLQFNLKPNRGNQLGTYINLGGYGNWLMFRRFSAKYETDVSNYSKTGRIGLGRIKYMEKWDFGPQIRYGKTNFAFFAKYRVNDFFKFQEGVWEFREMPRLIVGLQFFPGNI